MFKRIQNLKCKRYLSNMIATYKKANPLTQKIVNLILIASLIGAEAVTEYLGSSITVHAIEVQSAEEYQQKDIKTVIFPCSENSLVSLVEGEAPEITELESNTVYTSVDFVSNENDFALLSEIENLKTDNSVYVTEVAPEAKVLVEDVIPADTYMVEATIPEVPVVPEVPVKVYEPVYIDNPALVIPITTDEYELLAKLVECEAGDQDIIGKILVVNTVVNRVNYYEFANNVNGVIMAPRQFSPVGSGIIYNTTPAESTYEAVNRGLAGEDYSSGALYFMDRKYCSGSSAAWFDNNLTKVVEYGCHEFFK